MLNVETGTKLRVRIRNQDEIVLDTSIPYVDTFGGVDIGEPLIYLNSLNSISLALNQGNFAEAHGIGSGPDWSIQLTHD